MCKAGDLLQDFAVLTYFKHNKPMFKHDYAMRDEALERVINHGHEIVKAELIQRQYDELLNKLADFEFLHPEVLNDGQQTG